MTICCVANLYKKLCPNLTKMNEIRGKFSAVKNMLHVGMDLKEALKQGKDENTIED